MNDSFDLIGYVFSLILSDSFTASVTSLAAECKLPIPLMRKILYALLSNRLLLSHLESGQDLYDEDDMLPASEDFLTDMIRGKADDITINIGDMDWFDAGSPYLLPITPTEADFLREKYPDLLRFNRTGLFESKDIVSPISESVLKKQDIIQDAISRNRKIRFCYNPRPGDGAIITCSPMIVIRDLTANRLYLKDLEGNNYRLDRITSDVRILPETCDASVERSDPYQKYYWGIDSKDAHEKPVPVKVRFNANISNIAEKIRNDTRLRAETGKLYSDNEYYYYEDDILGIQDFRKWLRSFGSAVTVLEPESLISEIVNGIQRTLDFYEKLSGHQCINP